MAEAILGNMMIQFAATSGLDLFESIHKDKKGPRTAWDMYNAISAGSMVYSGTSAGFAAGGPAGAAAGFGLSMAALGVGAITSLVANKASKAYTSRARYRTAHLKEMRDGTHMDPEKEFVGWKMAQASYGKNDLERSEGLEELGYKYMKSLSNDRVAVYSKGHDLAIAIRGTDPTSVTRTGDDLYADLMIAIGQEGITRVFEDAAKHVDTITKAWKASYSDSKIFMDGHSLGGSIALHITSEHPEINARITETHVYEPGRSPFNEGKIPENVHINVNLGDPVSIFRNIDNGGNYHFHELGGNVHAPKEFGEWNYWDNEYNEEYVGYRYGGGDENYEEDEGYGQSEIFND